MPSVKRIVAGAPIRTIRFPWGDDQIVMHVRSSGITAAEVVDADLSAAEELGEGERLQRMVDTVAQSIAKCLVGWNVYLDDDETVEARTYEDVLLLPTEFLFAAFVALKEHAEADGSGEASAVSAVG